MTPEEQKAYSKGYQAGKRRKQKQVEFERLRKEEQAFVDRAFLAVLPACILTNGWSKGEAPITSRNDRVGFAWRIAMEALRQRGWVE